MQVAIRTDASARMGIGHLRRCLSLAQALRNLGARVRFVTRDLGIDSAGLIAQQGFDEVIRLPAPSKPAAPDPAIPHGDWAEVPQQQDINETLAALRADPPAWVVVDSYAFDRHWHEGGRAGLGCRIAQIDDVPDRDIAPDLLIDHNHAGDHRAKYGQLLPQGAALLGGPRYALLGPAFGAAPRYESSETVRSIGVFMGGVDAGNHSAVVLDAITAAGFDGPVEIVTTSANPNLPALRDRIAARPATTLALDLPDLAAFFARHDLQVGAGGGATWERCCIGAPTLLVTLAPNQEAVGPMLAREGVVALASKADAAAIAVELRGLIADAGQRRALTDRARVLVDGHGALRVAAIMLGETLHLRPATMDDAQRMFDWRNAEANRSVSRDNRPLAWEAHVAWLDRVIADPARQLYVGRLGDRLVGVIRFDFSGDARAEVSLYLDPALHGSGLGPRLLLAGEAAAGAATVDATVLETNIPSQRMFARCGYHRLGPDTWVKHRR